MRVLVDSQLNMSQQKSENRNIRSNNRIIRNRVASRSRIFPPLVRLQLEYCVQFWAPHYKDIRVLKHIQRRAVKLVKGLENKSYKEHLSKLGFFGSEKKRKRGSGETILLSTITSKEAVAG